jgi:signal transduction histidine kinase/DNA-binding response OmpR family regulator
MAWPITTLRIQFEHDVVLARQRAREIAGLLGFDAQDQVRIATAVSEIARNAFMYATDGKVEFQLEGQTAPQILIVRVSDKGSGIENLKEILDGQYRSRTGMGLGLTGARRLVDQCDIRPAAVQGTVVTLKKILPRRVPFIPQSRLSTLVDRVSAQSPESLFEEVQRQNQELLQTLGQLRERQDELVRLNRELEDTNRGVVALYAELDEKANHLTRADEMKTKFLSNMSHEFRTPLNSMLALTQLLIERADGELNAEQEKQVRFIRKGAESLLELVNDLLDIAKIEAGKIEVHPVEFTVGNLFSAIRGMLRPLLVNNSLNLIFEEPENLPLLYTDEGKISQVLRNFISNALKFTERGEVRVSAARDDSAQTAIFSVADTGIGIAAEDQTRIFEEFTQLDNPVQRYVKGFGLGLPLCRKLASLLGGSVSLQSELRVGSTFSLRVPMNYIAPAEELPRLIETLGADLDIGKTPVLVVEDEPETRLLYETYARDTEFKIIPAAGLRHAREAMRQVRPAAIILDIVLRGEDTWQWLSDLKAAEETKSIPVIVVSTLDDSEKGLALGAEDYLIKPVSRQKLIARLKQSVVARTPAVQTDSVRGEDSRRTSALVVDDEESARYVLKRLLGEFPIRVTEASSGAEGLRIAIEQQPDIIFLDLRMPDMSGWTVLQALKTDPATGNIPVVIITSETPQPDEQLKIDRTAQGLIRKEDLTVQAMEKALTEVQIARRSGEGYGGSQESPGTNRV